MPEPKTFTQEQVDQLIAEKTKSVLTQDKVDAIVQDRLAREKAKYADYDDLRKFRTDHEKQLEQVTQKELEAKKEYEKLKEGWLTKEKEYSGIISKKDSEITDMRISSALMGEIAKQNAYPDETLALIKSQAVIDKDGNVIIKGKDKNGIEVTNSVEEGIKQFLTIRPHLVKANKPGGGGTAIGTISGAGVGEDDLDSLNNQLQQAMLSGDSKKKIELRAKIGAALAQKKATL